MREGKGSCHLLQLRAATIGNAFVLRIPAYLNSSLQGLTGCTIVGRARPRSFFRPFLSWKELERLPVIAGCLMLCGGVWCNVEPLAFSLPGFVQLRCPTASTCFDIGTWQLTFTASHWQRIAGPVEEAGSSWPFCMTLLAALALSNFVHAGSFFHLLMKVGVVSTGVAKALQGVLVFVLSHLLYCKQDESQCFSPVKGVREAEISKNHLLPPWPQPGSVPHLTMARAASAEGLSRLSYGDGSIYWDERYLTKASPDEWLLAWSQVADVFEKYCGQPRRQWKILHAGCGNSALTAETRGLKIRVAEDEDEDEWMDACKMYRAGYEHITSIDNSATVIAQMQAACRDSASLKWWDMFSWHVIGLGLWHTSHVKEMNFDDGSFDVVIEKGLLDCLGCMDEAKLEVAKVLKEVHRVLRLQGLFFCISFNHNRAAQLADEPWKFSLCESRRISAAGGQNSLYVFRKSSADVLRKWPQLFRDLKLHLTNEESSTAIAALPSSNSLSVAAPQQDYQLVDQPCALIEGEAEAGNVVEVIEAFESGTAAVTCFNMLFWDQNPVGLHAGLRGVVKLRDHDGDALIRFPRPGMGYTGTTRKAPPAPNQKEDSALPRSSERIQQGDDSDAEMAVEEMSELKGFNMPLSFGKQKPVRTAGPQAHNATQRKGRGEKPVPKGVQFGPRITDVAAKAGAQARMGRATAPEVQPGPEEDDEEEEERVGPVMPTGREEPDELPEPGKELEVIPVTHEVEVPCFDKAVTAIGLDPKGSRMIAGGLDGTLKFFDFHGMSEAKEAFRDLEPVVGKMVHSISFSTTGGQVLVVCSDASARIYDRDGSSTPIQQTVLGDMYVRQMEHTKGHTQTLTAGVWHPFRSEHFLTASLDGTMRIWDMTADPVGMDQQLPCIHVLKTVDKRNVCVGGGSGKQGGLFPTCCTYSPTDAKKIVAGCSDGSVQLFFDKARFMRPDSCLTVA
eukprot:s32_g45.t1